MSRACCPGSFDPVTNGHVEIIERAARMFDSVSLVVLPNPAKQGLFDLDERMQMLTESTAHLDNVEVGAWDRLLVDFCKQAGVSVIVKGLRAVTDFDYEMQMAQMNARMGVETAFLATNPEFSFLSSSLMKEIVRYGGDVVGLVPPVVAKRLDEKFRGP